MLGILIVLYGVVVSERTTKRVWDIGYSFPMLAPKLIFSLVAKIVL